MPFPNHSTKNKSPLVIITVHHIIADGWSLGIVSTDLGELYAKETGAKHKNLTPAKQLSQYALEYSETKETDEYLKAENYWVQPISGRDSSS